MGTTAKWQGSERPMCDFCRLDCGKIPVPAEYDAKTISGPWACLCGPCFRRYGFGLGTGLGQKLTFTEE